MANDFETCGIIAASTHRKEHSDTPDQVAWANHIFGKAYQNDVQHVIICFEGYPKVIPFVESSIKKSAEKLATSNDYSSLENDPTVNLLYDKAKVLSKGEQISVLCWGPLTEPVVLVAHCMTQTNWMY